MFKTITEAIDVIWPENPEVYKIWTLFISLKFYAQTISF